MEDRRLAMGGLLALGLGSVAMAVGNYLDAGLTFLVGQQLIVAVLVAVTVAWARANRSALRFRDPGLPAVIRTYGPLGIAVLGGITLVAGVVLLTLVVR